MRRADHVGKPKQHALGGRLLAKHVKRRAGNVTGFKRRGERSIIDQLAARAIDQPHAALHLRERFRVDDVAGLFGERRMQRDEIGAPPQLVQFDLLHAELKRALGRQKRVVGDDFHLQAERAVGDDRADIAAADDAQRLAEDFHAEKFVFLPLAGAGRAVGFRNLPSQRQHQRDRMFRGRDRIAEWRIHHNDAARGRGCDVDVVDADAGPADHLQALGVLQQLARDLGRGAYCQPVEAVDGRGQLVLVLAEIRLELDVEAAILENRNRSRRQRIGNKDSRRHAFVLSGRAGAGGPHAAAASAALALA